MNWKNLNVWHGVIDPDGNDISPIRMTDGIYMDDDSNDIPTEDDITEMIDSEEVMYTND